MSKLDLQDVWWDHSIAGLAIVNKDGVFEEVNPTWAEMLGYTTGELIGKPFSAITHPKDLDDDMRMVRTVLAGDAPGYTMNKRYLHKLGYDVWMELKVVAIRDGEGKFHAFFSQVIPATRVEARQNGRHIEKAEKAENLAPSKAAVNWQKWAADNAKWLIPMLLGGLALIANGLWEFIVWKITGEGPQ